MTTKQDKTLALCFLDTESEEWKQAYASLPDEPPEAEKPVPTDDEFWERCKIPNRFRREEAALRRFPEWSSKLILIQDKIVSEAGFCIAIRGPRGTGKTQLAIEAMKFAYKRGIHSRMTSARDIQLATTDSFKRQDVSDLDILESFIKVPLLLIDEFDWRPGDKAHYYNSNLFYILDKRYSWMKSTILTSNATKEEFLANVDPGILSRMAESGGRIDCDGWNDYRRNKC